LDPLNGAMQNKVNKPSIEQKLGYENKEIPYNNNNNKKNPLVHLEYLGKEIIHQERDIKNDGQRPHFEEVRARVSVGLSQAYAYILTSKQVLKSLCEL